VFVEWDHSSLHSSILGAGRDWKDRAIGGAALVFDVATAAAETFGPLKATLEAISTVYNQYKVRSLPTAVAFLLTINLQETAAVRDKIEVLRSRIGTLEEIFDKPADEEEEKRRRGELLTYVIDLRSIRILRASQYTRNYGGNNRVVGPQVRGSTIHRSCSR